MESVTPSLEIRNLVKTYGTTRAVDGVSLQVGQGEILGLLGPNGAGKTSLLECALGLRQQDSGEVLVGGLDMQTHGNEVKQRIGAVLQSTALQDAITPREALELFGSFFKRAIPAAELLERFALTGEEGKKFETLSGGQRQRLALALAFVNDPQVLFLDEPTSGLDPQARRQLHESIKQCRKDGRSVLLTTHYIEEAEVLCDRIAILYKGKIVATGSPEELIAHSKRQTRLVARVTGSPVVAELAALPGVSGVSVEGGIVTLEIRETGPVIIELVEYLSRTGNELLDLQVKKPSLEDVFIEFTGESGGTA